MAKARTLNLTLRRSLSTTSFKNKILIETDELEKLMKENPENLSIFNASYTTATFQAK